MNHYKHQYEVHVFTNLDDLKMAKPLEFPVIITGEYTTDELADFVERGEILLVLTETEVIGECSETLVFTEKYQEVYKIAELLLHLVAERDSSRSLIQRTTSCKWIGVYSLSREEYQISFVSLLARLYGEEERVLILDLQNYSGLVEGENDFPHMGLEDLLSVAICGTYSRGRVLDCIGHESNWDFVYPVKNNQCLLEGTAELYRIIIDILEKELGYQKVIINFGAPFAGQHELMEQCHRFYLLHGKDHMEGWREDSFFRELQNCGKMELMQKVEKVEIPTTTATGKTWKTIADEWYWNSFGELIRQRSKKEFDYGSVM